MPTSSVGSGPKSPEAEKLVERQDPKFRTDRDRILELENENKNLEDKNKTIEDRNKTLEYEKKALQARLAKLKDKAQGAIHRFGDHVILQKNHIEELRSSEAFYRERTNALNAVLQTLKEDLAAEKDARVEILNKEYAAEQAVQVEVQAAMDDAVRTMQSKFAALRKTHDLGWRNFNNARSRHYENALDIENTYSQSYNTLSKSVAEVAERPPTAIPAGLRVKYTIRKDQTLSKPEPRSAPAPSKDHEIDTVKETSALQKMVVDDLHKDTAAVRANSSDGQKGKGKLPEPPSSSTKTEIDGLHQESAEPTVASAATHGGVTNQEHTGLVPSTQTNSLDINRAQAVDDNDLDPATLDLSSELGCKLKIAEVSYQALEAKYNRLEQENQELQLIDQSVI